MASKSTVQIIIETIDKGSAKAVGGVKKLWNAWKDLATPLNQTVELFGKIKEIGASAIAAIGEGATAAQTAESFERLNESLWQTPDLLAQLKEQSRGTINETKLMAGVLTLTAGATDELSRAYAEAAPQLVKMAKAANKLNPTLGDTEFLYDSISTGIKRASPLILDNLGIVVKAEEAYRNYAKEIGKLPDELSSTEKQYAFLNEAMRAGNTLIEQVGGNVDALGDPLARMNTLLEDARSNFLAAFSGEVVAGVDDISGGMESVAEDATTLGEALGELAVNVIPVLARAAQGAAETIGTFAKSINFSNDLEEALKLGVITDAQAREATIAYRDLGQDAGIAMLQGFIEKSAITQEQQGWTLWEEGIKKEANRAKIVAEEAGVEVNESFKKSFEDLGYDPHLYMLEGIRNVEKYREMGEEILEHMDLVEQYKEEAVEVADAFWDAYSDTLADRMAASGDFFTEAAGTDFFGVLEDVEDFDFSGVFSGFVDEAGASASALAGVTVALGDMTEAEANAVLQGAFLIESLEAIASRIAQGLISPESGVEMATQLWEDFQAGVDIVASAEHISATPYVEVTPIFDWQIDGQSITEEMGKSFAQTGNAPSGGFDKVQVGIEPQVDPDSLAKVMGEFSTQLAEMPEEQRQITISAIQDGEKVATALGEISTAIIDMPIEQRQVMIEGNKTPAADEINLLITEDINPLIEMEPTVDVKANTAEAVTALGLVKAAADAIPREININVTVTEEEIPSY